LTTQNNAQAGIPGVRETPILGKLLTGTDDRISTKELVLLLSTNIVPAPQMNVIVGESL
jgi:Flp pilus assembly secretin CpaC